MQNKIRFSATLFLLLTFMVFSNRCGVVQQTQQMANLVNCDFRIASVQNLMLAGVNIQNVQSLKSLNLMDAAKIMTAVAGSSFPLTFQLNIEGKNPNSSPAGMNKMMWILLIDNIQMTSGSVNNRFTIPPNNGTANIPLQININLKQVLQGKSLDAIANFAFNLAGVGNKPTRITAKIQPTIMIGNTPLTYPGYITINTEFSGPH
ncbi:MAG: hypothetical protein NTU98_02475 [Bacteroidetes bacterium]|nr:hypothetical protein [Bacteroidota bacterium]